MKNLKAALVLTIALATSIGFNNFAKAETVTTTSQPTYKVAVVTVAAVLAASPQVQALKKEQQTKLAELEKWLITVRADVEKQATTEGKEKLIKKYDAEFAKKQEAIKSNYAKKLEAIDKNISTAIEQERQAKGYDIVLARGVVLSGGIDITQDIIKRVK